MSWEPWLKAIPANPSKKHNEGVDEYEFEFLKNGFKKDDKGVLTGPPADITEKKDKESLKL